MIHRTHHHQALLTDGVSASDAMDALLHDLGQTRARTRPQGRPFVTLAYAQSVDGSISIARGQRSALSGPDSLRFTHALRAGHDGILVGVGTVVADDPELRVRLVDGRDPQPVIVDSHLRTPAGARLLAQSGRQPWIGSAIGAGAIGPEAREGERRSHLEARGARVLDCGAQANGWVDLSELLGRLHAAGIEHLMVEGGARIITSFLEARLVDYVTVTIAPLFMGGLSAVGKMIRSPPPAPAPAPTTAAMRASAPAPASGAGPTPLSPAPVVPNLGRWVSARLGHDLVISGEICWPPV
jgi:GTP cyclohydrolase II